MAARVIARPTKPVPPTIAMRMRSPASDTTVTHAKCQLHASFRSTLGMVVARSLDALHVCRHSTRSRTHGTGYAAGSLSRTSPRSVQRGTANHKGVAKVAEEGDARRVGCGVRRAPRHHARAGNTSRADLQRPERETDRKALQGHGRTHCRGR